ncbi:MAG: DUF952 domain-containing protein [Rhodoferax sp.]|nr:DUF952 domain-containing protein [Rhodoferax sp.]
MSDLPDDCIFHICSRAAADAAKASGSYRAPSLATEGFIHLSRAHQVAAVLRAFYRGQSDLVLLVVQPDRLQATLRYEAPSPLPAAGVSMGPDATQLFPHLYGALNIDAVVDVVALPAVQD